jgi:hypothetical protein
MSEYTILLYRDEERDRNLTDAETAELLAQHQAFRRKYGSAIKLGHGLQWAPAARCVHVGDGSMAVTDGPFVETKEALGGFYVVEAADLDEAIRIAADVPVPHGGVEVRPVMVFDR